MSSYQLQGKQKKLNVNEHKDEEIDSKLNYNIFDIGVY